MKRITVGVLLLTMTTLITEAGADTIPDRFWGTYASSGQSCDPTSMSNEFPFLIVEAEGVKSYEGTCNLLSLISASETDLSIECEQEAEGESYGKITLDFSLSGGQRCNLSCSDPWPEACGTAPQEVNSGRTPPDYAEYIEAAVLDFGGSGSPSIFESLIKNLSDLEFLPPKEVWRADYISTWVPQKTQGWRGFDISLIEHEFFDVNAGCCVNPGIGIVITGDGDIDGLRLLAELNNCEFRTYENLASLKLYSPNAIVAEQSGAYIFSCRKSE